MNINEHDRKEIKGCMKMKEELIQNNDSVCIKRTIPLFSEEEIKNIDENFISIVNEYSKMLVKEKEQKTIQLLLKKQNEEIERLNNMINEALDYIRENNYCDINGFTILNILSEKRDYY